MASTEENTPSGVAQSVQTSTRIEMLWHDLKRELHTRHPKNIVELKQFCEEEWSKIPPDRCASLICNYRKRLVEVIAAKGGSTSYKLKGSHTFPTLHCECLRGVCKKAMKQYSLLLV